MKSLVWILSGIFFIVVFTIAAAARTPLLIWSVQEAENTTHNGAIAYSPDGRLVASGRSDSNSVNIRDAETGALIRTLTGQNNNANVIAFSPNGLYLATGTGGGGQNLSLNLWRVSDGVRLVGRIPAFTNGTISLSFSPDSELLVASGFHATGYKIYHVPDMTLLSTIGNFDPRLGYNVRINAVAFSPDGQIIAVGDNNSIKLRNAADGSLIRTINIYLPYAMKTTSLAFTHNGQFIAGAVTNIDSTYGNCIDCSIKMFTVGDGMLQRTFTLGAGIPYAKIGFSPDDKVIGAGFADEGSTYGGSSAFWQVSNRNLLLRDQRAFWVQDFAYSPVTNRFAFFGADGVIAVGRAPLPQSDW